MSYPTSRQNYFVASNNIIPPQTWLKFVTINNFDILISWLHIHKYEPQSRFSFIPTLGVSNFVNTIKMSMVTFLTRSTFIKY